MLEIPNNASRSLCLLDCLAKLKIQAKINLNVSAVGMEVQLENYIDISTVPNHASKATTVQSKKYIDNALPENRMVQKIQLRGMLVAQILKL